MKFTKDEIRRAMLLYAVTDRSWLKEGETLEDRVHIALENGASFVQLREKELEPAAFEALAARLQKLCADYSVPFVVNDSVELALRCGADGVHVGQSDIKGRDIRALIGPERLLGISAATVEEATAAERAGADYIGVGAVFPTGTKKNARSMTMERLREIVAAVSIPVVAIGGINQSNIAQLHGSGVDGVAVVSAIFAAQEPAKAVAELLEKAKELVAAQG